MESWLIPAAPVTVVEEIKKSRFITLLAHTDGVEAAKEAGFHLAVTTMKGKVKPGDNPLLLKRLYILRTDSLETMS
ncbi:hypothetical protein ACSLOV_19730, partial [Escherichia coli]